jgi:hypothetical protein
MARIRTIKPEFPQSESMGRVSRESRLCFILLFTLADDAGRLRGNSRMLASLLYPYDDDAKKHIETWLVELSKEGCIVRYTIEEDQYIQILQWAKHQKIDKPTASKIPPAPESSRILSNPLEMSSEDSIKDSIKEGNGKDTVEPPDGVSIQVWKDFVKSRKVKLTQTALDGIQREAIKAGWSLDDAMRECCARGWRGFKAEWVADKSKPEKQQKTFAERDREAGWARWEEQTGRIHPERNKSAKAVIDVKPLEIE